MTDTIQISKTIARDFFQKKADFDHLTVTNILS